MNNYIRYYDPRYGDIYEIFVDNNGEFLSAQRSMEKLGQNPIYYSDLDEIPSAHRAAVEEEIEKWKTRK